MISLSEDSAVFQPYRKTPAAAYIKINIICAKHIPPKDSQGSARDTFCVITYTADRKFQAKTAIVRQSLYPKWDDIIRLPINASIDGVSVTVACYHKTMFGKEFLGQHVITDSQLRDHEANEDWFRLLAENGTQVVPAAMGAQNAPEIKIRYQFITSREEDMQLLKQMLESNDDSRKMRALKCLANLASSSNKMKDHIRFYGFIPMLFHLLNSSDLTGYDPAGPSTSKDAENDATNAASTSKRKGKKSVGQRNETISLQAITVLENLARLRNGMNVKVSKKYSHTVLHLNTVKNYKKSSFLKHILPLFNVETLQLRVAAYRLFLLVDKERLYQIDENTRNLSHYEEEVYQQLLAIDQGSKKPLKSVKAALETLSTQMNKRRK